MTILKNKSLYLTYITGVALAIVFYFVLKLPLSPLNLIFGFFFLLLGPGFSLSRILNLNPESNLDKITDWITLGFILIFTLTLVAIVFGFSMNLLILTGLVIFILVFLVALGLDLWRKDQFFQYNLMRIQDFSILNLITGLILLVLIVFTLIVVDGLGGLFKGGDPSFHLAIVNKAFEGFSLSAGNLSLVKGSIHVTYGYPVWHVLIAMLARIFHSDIFITWRTLVMPVSLLSVFVWYSLARKIMPTKSLAIFTVIVYLVYILNKNTAFLFTCISIPDTLNNLIFMPLSIGLVLSYVFDSGPINLKKDWVKLVMIALISIFMAIIHLTQFFYFLMLIFIIGLVYLLFFWREKETKLILTKCGVTLGANLIVIVPLIVVLAIKSNILDVVSGLFVSGSTELFPALVYGSFSKFNTLAKYAYVFSPLLFFFVYKNRCLTFLVALFLVLPLCYLEPVKLLLMKTLGYIFVNRIYGSLVWHFAIWAFVFGIFFTLIDRLMNWLSFSRRVLKVLIDLMALVFLAIFIWAETNYQFANIFYSGIYSVKIDQWLNHYYGVVILIFSIIGLTVFYFQKSKLQFAQFFELQEAKTLWFSVLIATFMILMLTYNWPSFSKWFTDGSKDNYLTQAATYDPHAIYTSAGGQEIVDFINHNVPRKSVILVPGNLIYNLPIVTDQYMAGYPRSSVLDRYLILYSDKYTDEQKLANLNKSKINYILLYKPGSQNIDFFTRHPELFDRVYNNGSIMFKVKSN